jgi:hypothetical protein
MVWNAKQKKYELDRTVSVIPGKALDPYVWAYEVRALAKNPKDGIKDMTYVVDARTGALLKVSDELRGLDGPNPPALQATDIPVKGTGYSQYNGTVTLDTIQRADGTFAMIDRTRGSSFIPYFHDSYVDYNTMMPILDELGNPISIVGLQALAEVHTPMGAYWHWFDKNTSNVWGDGKQFNGFPPGNETSANGQTAAVDAHYALATTWDFFKNVFGRDGIDGEGRSQVTAVHSSDFFGWPGVFAFWSSELGLTLGDGDRASRTNPATGEEIPGNPDGYGSMTSLDIVGHELVHGVIEHSAALDNYGEAGAIAEATSDFFGVLIKGYAKRTDPYDSKVTETGLVWTIGEQLGKTPFRDMRKPSSIDYGRDNWYAGLEYTQLNYQSGVMNRAFYFLSQGASSTAAAADYSPYLPGGMAGLGADQAARIWYKALTEYLTPHTTFAQAREAAISAASDMYGPASAQVTAVRRAFAAVNVGNAVEGVEHVRVNFPLVHPPGTIFSPEGAGDSNSRIPFVAMGQTVHLEAEVQNTSDKRVQWKLGGILGSRYNPGFQHEGGVIDSDGNWTPDNDWGYHALTVISKADPLQYAEGAAFVLNGDADSDLEFDAIDLGAVALSWGLDSAVKWSHSVLGSYSVSSFDVAAIVEAFTNSYGGQ